MEEVKEIIRILELQPLAREGGLFKSTYRSPGKVGDKDMGSAILFMLTGEGFSHLHRLATDEVYHFYKGDPVELLELFPMEPFVSPYWAMTSSLDKKFSTWCPQAHGRGLNCVKRAGMPYLGRP